MKIGILTYHRSQNFGALLQAIALRTVLINLGHEVYFIDYWPDYHKRMYKVIDWSLLSLPYGLRSLYLLARSLYLHKSRKKRSDIFKSFISKYIEKCIRPYDGGDAYDVIIYGSDQIWRKQAGLKGKFNPVYFGDNNLLTDRSISYAASMGVINCNSQEKSFIAENLSKFDNVLVREKNLQDLLNDCGISSSVVLDPTLLLDADEWKQILNLNSDETSDYILFYDLQMDSIDYSVVMEYANKRNLKVKVISGETRSQKKKGMEYLEYADPEEFVKLIYNAKEVLTSSYHGLVFSLLFNKDFFTFFIHNQGRAKSLLESLSLSERMLSPHIDKIPILDPVDYQKVNSILQGRKEESFKLLTAALTPSLNS